MEKGIRIAKKALLGLLLSALIGAVMAQGTVLEDRSFESETLGRAMEYTVYLPEGYDTDARSYPVVYMLHGYDGEDTDWVRFGNIDHTADRLIASGDLPPVIIVMPDAGNSYYLDGSEGAYETAIAEDLVAHVDGTYRTLPERSSRVIGGLSMGGFGAASLALKHMDTFAAAGVMSGALWSENPRDDPRSVFHAVTIAAGYARLCGLPSPADVCMNVYITVGDDDEDWWRDAPEFYAALVEAGIPAELRISDGGHTWAYVVSTLEDVLRFFADAMARYY